jgi:hypothetical protein
LGKLAFYGRKYGVVEEVFGRYDAYRAGTLFVVLNEE